MADDEDFARFVRAHSSSLFGTAVLLSGNRHDAEDLVQDTLVHLYPRWERVIAAESPVAYVRRAVVNRFVSRTRAPAARTASMWELPDGWDGRDLGERVAVTQTVWQLLATLPERQRAALVLRYFHDLPDDEIAAAIGCRAVTVRSLVSRGMAALRTAYTSSTRTADGSLR